MRGHVVSLGSVQGSDHEAAPRRGERAIDLAVAHQAPEVLPEEEDESVHHERPRDAMDGLLFRRLEVVMTAPPPVAPAAKSEPPSEDRETRLEKTARRMQELQMIMGMFSPFGMSGMYGIDGTVVFGLLGGVLLLTVAGGLAAFTLTRRNRAPVRRIRLSLARSSTSSSSSATTSSSSTDW